MKWYKLKKVGNKMKVQVASGTVKLQVAEIKKVEDFKYFGSTTERVKKR